MILPILASEVFNLIDNGFGSKCFRNSIQCMRPYILNIVIANNLVSFVMICTYGGRRILNSTFSHWNWNCTDNSCSLVLCLTPTHAILVCFGANKWHKFDCFGCYKLYSAPWLIQNSMTDQSPPLTVSKLTLLNRVPMLFFWSFSYDTNILLAK